MEYQGSNNTGGWGNQQSNWGNQQSNWGNQPPQSGWGNQPPQSGWGNQPQNNWGGNQQSNWGSNNNGWGNQPPQSGWGNQPPQSGWGNQPQSNWGGNQQSNWGPNNNGWGNQPQSNFGNQQSNWGNQNQNNGPITFIIKPIEAKMLKDLDTFSKMDPFCAIEIGGNKQRTKTCQGGGKNPKFFDTLTFNNANSKVMSVAVFDEDVTTNELAGQGTYDLTNAVKNMGMSNNEFIDLLKNGKSAGRVLISVMAQQGQSGW